MLSLSDENSKLDCVWKGFPQSTLLKIRWVFKPQKGDFIFYFSPIAHMLWCDLEASYQTLPNSPTTYVYVEKKPKYQSDNRCYQGLFAMSSSNCIQSQRIEKKKMKYTWICMYLLVCIGYSDLNLFPVFDHVEKIYMPWHVLKMDKYVYNQCC